MSPTRSFRSRSLYRVEWAATVGFPVLAILEATLGKPGPHGGVVDRIGLGGFGVLAGAVFYRSTRMRVVTDGRGVCVVGYFASRQIAWSEIVGFSANYSGLRVRLGTGEVVTAPGLGKSNWSSWLRRRTKVDDVVDALNAELRENGPPGTGAQV